MRCERRKSLVNDTVTISEKPITHSIDEVALLITRLTKAARKKGVKELYGKTADLKSAYRQLAISDESLKYSYLAVFDPVENKPKLFHQLAVPFGSILLLASGKSTLDDPRQGSVDLDDKLL